MDDTAILHDFLNACLMARMQQRQPRPRGLPGRVRDRASRLLRQALLRR